MDQTGPGLKETQSAVKDDQSQPDHLEGTQAWQAETGYTVEDIEEGLDGTHPCLLLEKAHPASEKNFSSIANASLTLQGLQGKMNAQQTWRSRFQDDDFRRKLIKTVLLCFSFVALGVCAAMGGPTFLDVQLITGTNVQQASAFFTAGSVGYVLGSLLGGLVYDLLSKNLILVLGLFGLATMTVATPYCRLYWLMVAVSVHKAIFGGVIDPVVNPEVIRMWGSEAGMAMQAIHFSFALGGVIAPLFTQPFLAPRAGQGSSAAGYSNISGFSSTKPFSKTSLHYTDNTFFSSQPGSASIAERPTLSATSWTQEGGLRNRSETEFINGLNSDPPFIPSKTSDPASYVPDWMVAVNTSGPRVVLVDTLSQTDKPLDRLQLPAENVTKDAATFLNVSLYNVTEAGDVSEVGTRVHYAFLIAGLITLLPALLLLTDYLRKPTACKMKWTRRRKQKTHSESNGQERERKAGTDIKAGMSTVLRLFLLVWVCTFFMLYVACEDTFLTFLTTFVVLQLDWSKSDGAMLTSVFWASFATFRFVCIWVSRFVTSVQLLMTCSVLMVLSFIAFLLASIFAMHSAVWAATAITGAAMSAIFPAGLSWMEAELLPVTGRTTAAIALASTMVLTVNQQVLGHLLETRGAIWLAYMLLGEAVACLVTFLLLLLFARTRLKRSKHAITLRHQHVINVNVTDGHQAEKPLNGEEETLLRQENNGQITATPNHADDCV